MTLEEALWYANNAMIDDPKLKDFFDLATNALRLSARQQAVREWKGEWKTVAESAWTKDYKCSKCYIRVNSYFHFCPNCGAPMTDEAVQIVMERLEGLLRSM